MRLPLKGNQKGRHKFMVFKQNFHWWGIREGIKDMRPFPSIGLSL